MPKGGEFILAGYDGSIRINTKGDATGFNNLVKDISGGLSGIKKSLAALGSATAVAFGVKFIVAFSKASIQAANELGNAMTGLQSIMEGQGRSFQQAQKFINEYIEDGLIPATNAVNAYKNLALRGYDDTQIQKVLIALKDSAAFGRQASYSLGDAVESATEGLKNENSILVDNAGVTKNVAKMWDEYAKSIGTTSNNLSQQQKIQAEVLGILEESKYQVGDAAKVANTYSGELLRLGYSFNNLKIAMGNALIPMARAVLPSINAIIMGLTRLANVFAQVSALIFGRQKEVISDTNKAAKAQTGMAAATDKLGAATKKANKELKTTLASFDELNILARDTAEDMEDIAGAMPDVAGAVVPGADDPVDLFSEVDVSPRIEKFINGIKNSLKEVTPYTNRLTEAWGRLKSSMDRAWNSIQALNTGLVGLFVELLKNKALDIMAFTALGLAGALDTVAGLLLLVASILTGDWSMALEGAKTMLLGLGELVEAILIIAIGRNAVESLKTFIGEWGRHMKAWWSDDVVPWFSKEKWMQLWKNVKQWWADGWDSIEIWWNEALPKWWNEKVSPWFTRDKWVEMMVGVKEGFAITFKNAVNSAIELFNQLIDWINSKMKFEWEPVVIAGVTVVPGGSVQLFTVPKIPKLATGGVIPPNSEFLAILGDQKHGKNIEAPANLIRQMVEEALDARGMGGEQNVTVDMPVYLDGREVFRNQKKIAWQQGRNLVKGVTP